GLSIIKRSDIVAQKIIKNPMDDNRLNSTNHNFTELYSGFRDTNGKINKVEKDINDRMDNFIDETSDAAFDKVVDSARLNWDTMVEKYSDLPSDAETGTTIGVKEDSLVYRYDGSKWVDIYEINLNPISEVDDRLSSQLAETDSKIDSANIRSIEPLNIYTFDGTFQPYHPSVLYFGDVRWNGYKFWMVQTPFPIGVPPYRDRWECPSILASDDGINWDTPHGATVPLVDLTQEQIDRKDYFSDPCLVMNGSTMEVWYRHTNGADIRFTNVYRMTSEDGFTWSEPEIVLDVADNNNGLLPMEYMRSQQVFYENGTY